MKLLCNKSQINYTSKYRYTTIDYLENMENSIENLNIFIKIKNIIYTNS